MRQPPSPGEVDWSGLTPESRATLKQVVMRFYFGFSRSEVAAQLGTTPAEVGRRLASLRADIRKQVGGE